MKELPEESTNVFMTPIQSKYAARPAVLKDVCLAEFAAGYNFISNAAMEKRKTGKSTQIIQEDEDELDDDCFEQMNEDLELDDLDNSQPIPTSNSGIIKLKNNLGYIERRQKLKIIRYRGFSMEQMPDEYYREQVMLFMPWQNEQTEVEVDDPFEVFKKHSHTIAKNRRMFENLVHSESEAEAILRIEEQIERQEDLNFAEIAAERIRIDDVLMGRPTNLDPNTDANQIVEQLEEELRQQQEEYEEETGFHAEGEEEQRAVATSLGANKMDSKARKRMEDDEYKRFMCRLNRAQHTFLINCLNKVKLGESFHELVVGESGTGKSNLIKALDQCINRHLRKYDNSEPDKERVILCSFTGKASFNIGGVTLHSAFHLPVRDSDMAPLVSASAEEVRKKYRKLQLVIIDEISMVGANMFAMINDRLKQILNKKNHLVDEVLCFLVISINFIQ